MTFLALLYAHLLADYPLQGDYLARTKGQNVISLASHAGIWTGTICVAASLLGMSITILDVAVLFVVHAVADFVKARSLWFYKRMNPSGLGLAIDQLKHVGQIAALMITR